MLFATDNSPHFFATAICLMPKAELRITEAICGFVSDTYLNKHTQVYPSRDMLAKIAKCSVSKVRDYLKKYEGLLFTHKTRKRPGCYKHTSNLYDVNPVFFETVVLLKFMNLFHKIKDIKTQLLKKLSEDEYFLCRKWQLSTRKLPTEIVSKLPTIKSYLYSFHLNKSTLDKSSQISVSQRKNTGILQGISLNPWEIQKLEKYYSPYALFEAKKDYHWYEKQRKVNHPVSFLMSRAKQHQRKTL